MMLTQFAHGILVLTEDVSKVFSEALPSFHPKPEDMPRNPFEAPIIPIDIPPAPGALDTPPEDHVNGVPVFTPEAPGAALPVDPVVPAVPVIPVAEVEEPAVPVAEAEEPAAPAEVAEPVTPAEPAQE